MKQHLAFLGATASAAAALLLLAPTTAATTNANAATEFDYCVDATSDYVGYESGQEACVVLGTDLDIEHWEDGSYRFTATSGPNEGVWWIGCDGTLCEDVAA